MVSINNYMKVFLNPEQGGIETSQNQGQTFDNSVVSGGNDFPNDFAPKFTTNKTSSGEPQEKTSEPSLTPTKSTYEFDNGTCAEIYTKEVNGKTELSNIIYFDSGSEGLDGKKDHNDYTSFTFKPGIPKPDNIEEFVNELIESVQAGTTSNTQGLTNARIRYSNITGLKHIDYTFNNDGELTRMERYDIYPDGKDVRTIQEYEYTNDGKTIMRETKVDQGKESKSAYQVTYDAGEKYGKVKEYKDPETGKLQMLTFESPSKKASHVNFKYKNGKTIAKIIGGEYNSMNFREIIIDDNTKSVKIIDTKTYQKDGENYTTKYIRSYNPSSRRVSYSIGTKDSDTGKWTYTTDPDKKTHGGDFETMSTLYWDGN